MRFFAFLKKPAIFYLVLLSVIVSGCVDEPSGATDSERNIVSENTISIAAFNIQVFGKTKAGKPDVMDILSKTIRNFDIVAIQEIRDISETALPKLLEAVNSDNSTYEYIVSARLGRTSYKEQYAYIYNTQAVELAGTPYVYPESTGDLFHREPYIARFRILDNNRTFVLIAVHTDPDEATQEIEALPSVIESAKATFTGETDFILLGDLNADCKYFDEDDKHSLLRNSKYFWAIGNSADTTTKSTDCAYDRIIFTSAVEPYFTGDSGVFRFDTEYGLTYEETVAVSDHYPVYAVFYNKIPEHSSIWAWLFGP